MALCFVIAQLDCDGFILHLTTGRLMGVPKAFVPARAIMHIIVLGITGPTIMADPSRPFCLHQYSLERHE